MKKVSLSFVLFIIFSLVGFYSYSQQGTPPGGINGFNEANDTLINWIAPIEKLVWTGAVLAGLVGGYRIAQKLFNGDRDTNKDLMQFGGGVLILVVIGLILRGIFLGQ